MSDKLAFHSRGRSRRSDGHLIGICLALIGLASPSTLCLAESTEPDTLDGLKSTLQRLLDQHEIPGAGIALISNGETLWCGGIGKANVAADIDVTCDTQFRVGSISKSLIALALLKLAQDGKIDLAARLHDIAPELEIDNAWESSNPVTVVNVLEHTAGFDDMGFGEVYNRNDPPDIPLLEVFRKFPEPQVVRWPPATRTAYSNPGYGIAGYLIEKTAGEPWSEYVRRNLLVPMGITRGEFVLTDANKALLAQGYHDHRRVVPYQEIYLRPAGDLKASPGEMALLVQFFLRRGRAGDASLIDSKLIERMEFPQTTLAVRHGLRLGYGLANYTEVRGGVTTHGHDGGIDGFISTYRYMPEQNWGYVVLLNSDASGETLIEMNALVTRFLSRTFAHVSPPEVPIDVSELRKFEGYYAPRAPRRQLLAFAEDLIGGIRVQIHDGALTRSTLFGPRARLFPVSDGLFRLERDPEATAVFFENASGVMCYAAFADERVAYAERTSPIWPFARLVLLGLCVALMASALVFGVVWILRWVFRRKQRIQHVAVRAAPFAASLTLPLALFGAVASVERIGEFGFFPFLFLTGTMLFAVLSVLGLWLALRVRRSEIHRGVWIHSLLVSTACCVLTAFMAEWHLLGLRMWA